jgi:tetratricopeptide (TPR) repeat protein
MVAASATLRLRRQLHPLSRIVPWVLLLGSITAFAGRSYSLRFVQDDSYITYRYARNVVRGLGPVYNPGERVEGYTNFLWMIMLASLGTVGVPFSAIIPLSQILGVLSGIGVIVTFFMLLRRFSTGPPALVPLALFLFAANGSFAYWCVSGMETGLFSLLLAAGFYAYLRDDSTGNRIGASLLLGLSALTRPEGALLFGVVFLHYVVRQLRQHRRRCSDALRTQHRGVHMEGFAELLVPFAVAVAPFYVWRFGYYGYPLPNTFYAKAGLDMASLVAGFKYLVDFLRAYGFWGLVFAVPIAVVSWPRTKASAPLFGFCLLALGIHCLYVVLVGGDVLGSYRFLVPLYFVFYFTLSESLWLLPLPRTLVAVALATVALLTFWGPFTPGTTELWELRANRQAEQQLARTLAATGSWLNENTRPDDWIACTTIGAIGYFSDRSQVDMLGLTDAVVAHRPETILGARLYWKERRYNTRHVLERAPAYICFSTGDKPSAAAERALFLRARFRRGYYAYPFSTTSGSRILTYLLFKAKPGVDSVPVGDSDVNVEFVDRYNAGINFVWASEYDSAVGAFRQCCELSPSDFPYGFERLGRTYLKMGRYDSAKLCLQRALAIDDWCVNSRLALGKVLARYGSHDSAAKELRAAVAYAPDYIAGYTVLSDVLIQVRRFGEAESVLVVCTGRFPEAADPALRLARVRLISGDSVAAHRDVIGVLERHPDDGEARALLDSLERRRGVVSPGPDG